MLHDIVKKGATNRSVTIRIIDSADGTPETGVEHNTAGIDLWYRREGAAKSSITEAALASLTTAHTDGGIEHIGDGYYRLDLPDAAFATGAEHVDFGGTVTDMVVIGGRVRLTDIDLEDSTRGGMTALPNADADAAGGLPISDAGGLDLDGRLDADVSSRLAPTTAGRTLDVTAGGAAGIDWGNVENATSTVGLTNTTVGTVTANSDMRGTDGANTATPPAASAIADAVLDEALAGHTTAGTLGKAISDGVTAWVTATGFSTLSQADVRTAVGLASANLDTQLSTIDTVVDSILVDTGTSIPAQITGLNDPTAAAIADAVLDEALSGHVTAGTLGKAVADIETDATAILADTNELQTNQGNWLTATGFSTHSAADVRSEIDSNSTQLAAILTDTGTTIPTSLAALNDISVSDVLTTAMTESYGTDGSALTLAQCCYLILGNVGEFALSGTTKTVKQLDGTTTAATYTLDDADNPTSITRAT